MIGNAVRVMHIATGGAEETRDENGKDRAAADLGRRGGKFVASMDLGAKLKSITTVAVIVFLLTSAAVAGPFEDGNEAVERGDLASAALLWKQAAEQGVAEAQFTLGVLHSNGWGVPQDHREASGGFEWPLNKATAPLSLTSASC